MLVLAVAQLSNLVVPAGAVSPLSVGALKVPCDLTLVFAALLELQYTYLV